MSVLAASRERVAGYLVEYETVLLNSHADAAKSSASAEQLRGYLRGLNTMRVLGMADWEDLDRRVAQQAQLERGPSQLDPLAH